MAQFPFLAFCRHSMAYRLLSSYFNSFEPAYFQVGGKSFSRRDSELYKVYEKLVSRLRGYYDEILTYDSFLDEISASLVDFDALDAKFIQVIDLYLESKLLRW